MCGIAGLFYFDSRTAQKETVQAMTDAISHRGPDGEGQYISGAIGLGHRRLAIIDLSPSGKQPMCNEDGTIWITYNGEIYNFLEVRKDLRKRGHIFQSNTDTEVIVHAYEEWGVDCVQRFNGMFAFALWDEPRQRLWLVRDRLGIKPLFFACMPHAFFFGSEIKAILSDYSIERTIDYESLAYYLALNYTPAPYTLFAHIRQLLPAHYLLVEKDGTVQDVEYWKLTYHENIDKGEKIHLAEFNELLYDSVKIRLMSDVPFGAFLSGGIDSSSVSYWMSQCLSEPVKTFSIGFGEKSFDETGYARQVANVIKSEHRQKIIKANAAEILPKIVWHAEEPIADSSMIPFYYLAEMTKKSVTMALGGDGADEILAGYETYQAYYVHRLYRLLPTFLRQNVIKPLINSIPMTDSKVSWDFKLKQFVAGGELNSEDAHSAWRMIFKADERKQVLSPIWHDSKARADVVNLYRNIFAETNARHPLNRLLYVDTHFYLPNDMLIKVDRMTMAHSLEARVPFLDHRLVEFAAALPVHLKLKKYLQKKYLLKLSLRGKLPGSIIWRKKVGFNVPNARWIKHDLKPFVMDNLSPTQIKDIGFLDDKVVQKILQDHFLEKADNSHKIWGLLTLSLWWQGFVKNH